MCKRSVPIACILLLLFLLAFLLTGCKNSSPDPVYETKTYGMKDRMEVKLDLYEDKTFIFMYSALSSHLTSGTYLIENDKLTLYGIDDTQFHFAMKHNKLYFITEGFSEMMVFGDEKPLADGDELVEQELE